MAFTKEGELSTLLFSLLVANVASTTVCPQVPTTDDLARLAMIPVPKQVGGPSFQLVAAK
jgi:hypothetical protein